MSKRRLSLFIGLLTVFSINCFTQTNTDPSVWKNIETSIHQQKALDVTLTRLAAIKKEAQKNDNAIELARSLCYMMLIKDIRTEDSLYFHNSLFIDSILQTSSNKELNLLMHYLQAQRLWKFRTKYLKFNRARYETKSATINYASLSTDRLDSLISYHFEQAKALNKALSQKNKTQWDAEQISWLSSSPLTFLFKPTLFDIISYEQISAISKIESSNALLSLFYQEWLPLSQDQMVDSLNALAKRSETKGSIFLFLRWLDAHKTDPAIYYFIETLLREHIYKSLYSNYNQNYQKQYEAYLASIISSPHPEVKARAVYQLCVLWKKWSLKYARGDYRYANYGQFFDTSYQQYAGKAVRLYDENRQLFKSYGFLQQQLEQLRTEILFPKLQILLDNEHEKNKPLLLKIQYKNVPVFYYRIVRLNFDEELSTSTTNKGFLLSHEMVGEEKIDLPLPVDYNPHRVFLKLPALSSGNYCLVFSKEPIDLTKTYSYQSFVVSDLAFLHTDDRVYVLNRGTGMPVKGAFILATSAKKKCCRKKI